MIAVLAAAAGKTIVKSPAVEVLSPPKSIVATDLFESLLLYIKHPLAVTVAVPKVRSAKSVNHVVPELVGATLVKFAPPAV